MRPPRVMPTPRQQECLACCWLGLTNQEIGRRLGVRETTVRKLLTFAYTRLGYDRREGSRTLAAAWLYEATRREYEGGRDDHGQRHPAIDRRR